MGLINLKTNLKSLRYGNDQLGGGSSNQPYIKAKIPSGFNNLQDANNDFILRGGILAVKDAATDVLRLGKMFIDTKSPNGLLFIAKQNLLSRVAVRTQTSGILNEGIYTPLSTLAEAGLVAFGGHVLKQGVNPFAGGLTTGAYSNNPNLYGVRVKSTQPADENRLFTLYRNTTQNLSTSNFGFIKGLNINPGGRLANSSNPIMISYTGGPGSILGVGRTNIRFADQRTGINNAKNKNPTNWYYGPFTWTPSYNWSKDNPSSTYSLLRGASGVYIKQAGLDELNNNVLFINGNQSIEKTNTWGPTFAYNVYQSGSLKPYDLVAYNPEYSTPPQQDGLGEQREWFNLARLASVQSWNSSSVSQRYEKSNKEQLGFSNNSNDLVYQPDGPVGTDAKLFSDWASSADTWTPNQQDELVELRKKAGDNARNNLNVYNVGTTSSVTPTQYAEDNNPNSLLKDNTAYPGIPSTNQQYPQDAYTFNQKAIQDVGKGYIKGIGKEAVGAPQIQDFRKHIRNKLGENTLQGENASKTGATPNSPNYERKNLEQRVNIGFKDGLGPGNKTGKNLTSYSEGSRKGPLDRLNAYEIYSSGGVKQNSEETPINDLVKFRIAVIDNSNPSQKTFIHFRAFIDSFSDSYNATWNPTTYLGRGENFYTYGNYTRTISMGWTVAAQSKQELIPMYKKLNYLASSLTPYYTPKGYMTGNLVQLTVGGYIYEQVGIITSLTYDIPEDSPWEIGISDTGDYDPTVKELSHIIRVTGFSFTPLQDFIPSVQPVGDWNGPSRYIALDDGGGNNNYDHR